MIYPIYVPSKKRLNGKTFKWLPFLNCEKIIIVEPQERDAYSYAMRDVAVLDENDKGIAYVRQKIKEHAELSGYYWYWVIDDDISSFHQCQPDGKLAEIPAKQALEDAQNIITNLS